MISLFLQANKQGILEFRHQNGAQFYKETETLRFLEYFDPVNALGLTFYIALFSEQTKTISFYETLLISSSPSKEFSECKIDIIKKLEEIPLSQVTIHKPEGDKIGFLEGWKPNS